MSDQFPICPDCKQALTPDAVEGLCPVCLIELAIGFKDEAELPAQGPAPRFEKFEIAEVIGRGAMGIVYKAWQKDIGRFVAIKTLLAGNLCSEAEARRFKAEAAAAGRLEHPGLIRLYEFGESNGLSFFSMEYVEGVTLDKALQGRPISPSRAAQYIRTMAEAVQYAHERLVLHRDLKPGNIILDVAGNPRVADFGLAKEMSVSSDLSQSGLVIGTPSYMAPEQARGEQRLTPAADVYGLGAILYEMLTGRPPFRAESLLETLRQTLEADPAPPRALNRKIPRDLESICLKCLEKEPLRRYGSAQALREDVDRFLRFEPVRARTIGLGSQTLRFCKRKPFHAAATAALSMLLLLMGASALMVRREMLRSNEYTAQVSAKIVSAFLNSLSAPVLGLVKDPEFKAATATGDRERLERFLNWAKMEAARSFAPGIIETFTVLSPGGERIARIPEFGNISNRSMRDYFHRPIRTPPNPGPYFSRLYISQQDNQPRLGIASPIPDPSGEGIAGVLLMGVAIGTLEHLGLNDPQQITAVIGEWDPSVRSNHVVWLHPAYGVDRRTPGKEPPEVINVDDPTFNRASWFRWYFDPAAKRYPQFSGPWLPGFARVPGTHITVVVQTRDWVGLAVATATAAVTVMLAGLAGRFLFSRKKL